MNLASRSVWFARTSVWSCLLGLTVRRTVINLPVQCTTPESVKLCCDRLVFVPSNLLSVESCRLLQVHLNEAVSRKRGSILALRLLGQTDSDESPTPGFGSAAEVRPDSDAPDAPDADFMWR